LTLLDICDIIILPILYRRKLRHEKLQVNQDENPYFPGFCGY
jgi:hypothetical protein